VAEFHGAASEGAIVASFGTVVEGLTTAQVDALVKAFATVPQRVVWKLAPEVLPADRYRSCPTTLLHQNVDRKTTFDAKRLLLLD